MRSRQLVSFDQERWADVACYLLIVGVLAGFARVLVQDISQPLDGWADGGIWEYTGFYLVDHLALWPVPHLDLINNDTFYPYGAVQVFQPWAAERDLWYAFCYRFLGRGPWLQIYYLLSLLVTAVGSFWLLRSHYGRSRALGFGLLITFFNIYPIAKYPGHFGYAIVHWTCLTLVCDFLLVQQVVGNRRIPGRLVLLRLLLLVLSLGQDLSYVASYGLLSGALSAAWIGIWLTLQGWRHRQRLPQVVQQSLASTRRSYRDAPWQIWLLIVLLGLFSWLYLPLIGQIYGATKQFDFSGLAVGSWWSHPLRLLVPYLPDFNPSHFPLDLTEVLRDKPEGTEAVNPGWFLLITGLTGLGQGRRQWPVFVPSILLVLLCLTYHPATLPTLKVFPWFTFNRVAGRASFIYPVILCLWALHLDLGQMRRAWWRQGLALGLVLLACLEFSVAYQGLLGYRPVTFDPAFFAYMEQVKRQPGEAVLDWPFCIASGNGVGSAELCPYYNINAGIFALRRFHHKKVMGQYYGRLHPSQLEPYLQAGWQHLFVPDVPGDIFQAKRQTRCFNEPEWTFFAAFYAYNDFAGINLYPDMLPAACVAEFYRRFGQPIAATAIIGRDGPSPVVFIPKSPTLQAQVNPQKGQELTLQGN